MITVSVVMITYNHEKFIAQAIEGVLLQKTNFIIELIIADDASEDNNQKIIEEYQKKQPDIIRPILRKSNLGAQSNFNDAFKHCIGKYIAICEGDDYWIDPLKLQKQVDFLETNHQYGLIYSKVKVYEENKNEFVSEFGTQIHSIKQLLHYSTIPTLSTCFRKNILDGYLIEIEPYSNDWEMSDYPLWIYFYMKSKVYCLKEITGVYRLLENSVSHSINMRKKLQFMNSCVDLKKFFCEKYNIQGCYPIIYEGHFATVCNLLLSKDIFNENVYKIESNKVKSISLQILILKILMYFKFGRKILKLFWRI